MKSITSYLILMLSRLWTGSVLRCLLFLATCLTGAGQTLTVNENLQHVFTSSIGGGSTRVWDLSIDTDGTIYAVGDFDEVDGQYTGSVVRFHPDGTLDPDYPIGTGYAGNVRACALQEDGKLIVTGGGVFNGASVPFLTRLTPDGELDPTFNVGEGPFNVDVPVRFQEILISGPDEIYVIGNFNLWDLTEEVSCVIRIRGDGSRDMSFTPEFFIPDRDLPDLNRAFVGRISRYSDGRLLLMGHFDQVNGEDHKDIIRLNPDGSIDDTFQVGSGPVTAVDPNANVLDILVQPDGKAIITGTFHEFSGTPVTGIVRLNEDGSVDPNFEVTVTGEGPFSAVGRIQMDSMGRLLINGFFDSVNGIASPHFVRLLSDGQVDPEFKLDAGFNPPSSGGFLAERMRLNDADEPISVGNLEVNGYSGNNLFQMIYTLDMQPAIVNWSFSMQAGIILDVTNPTEDILRLLASPDLTIWSPVATNTTRNLEIQFFEDPAIVAAAGPNRFYRLETIPPLTFELDNFDGAAPGTAPDIGTAVGEWSFPDNYVSNGAAEPAPSLFSIVPTSDFDPTGTGNSLKIEGNPSSNSNLPAQLPQVINEGNTERVITRFDVFVPSSASGGCFIYVGGDHGVGGFDNATARGPQLAFGSNNQILTYDGSPARSQGAYPRDTWLTIELDINLKTDLYALSMGPQGGTLTELGTDIGFRSGTIDRIDRFTVATFTTETSWLAYLDNVSVTAMP